MTNTKFRKKALLSSVAMLVVALIALSSATFAWYQAKLTVTSTGMTFTTNALSGLEIISASVANGNADTEGSTTVAANTAGWSDTTTTFYTGVSDLISLQPASYYNGHFYTTTGSGTTAAAVDPAKSVITAADTRNSYYLSEKVYFKFGNGTSSSGEVYLTSVSMTAGTAASMTGAIRVVVTDSSGALVGEYQAAAETSTAYVLKQTTGGVSVNAAVTAANAVVPAPETPVTAADYYTNDKTVKQGAGAVTAAKVCDITGTFDKTSDFCTVYVYFDGFDGDVTSTNATTIGGVQSILSNISLGFTLTDTTAA